ncbi:benzoyl-CoA oxygenase, partial [Variovorax sp. Varisp62]
VVRAYSIEEQLTWESLPAELSSEELEAAGVSAEVAGDPAAALPAQTQAQAAAESIEPAFNSAQYGATVPPWSAAHAYTNLFPPKTPTTATVVGNFNCTEAGFDSETHHIVLDFGVVPFPVLEGQS